MACLQTANLACRGAAVFRSNPDAGLSQTAGCNFSYLRGAILVGLQSLEVPWTLRQANTIGFER